MEKDILYIYKTEVELIKSVIDLAASRRVPINSRGEYDEWLSFDSITEALDDICKQINVNRQVEQHCYQTLLRMSAESEKHLTWWEKIAMIHRYLPHHTHEKSSKHSPSNVAHHHQQASASHKSLPTPTPHLMRLVEPERATLTRPSNIPTTSPGTLLEINNLSMLLNDTYGFQTKHELQRNRSSVPDSGLYVRRNLSTQDIHTSRGNISFADTTTPVRAKDSMHNFNEQGWMSHIGPSSSARRIHFQEDPATPDYLQRHEQHSEGLGNKEYLLSSVMEKVSSIEKETQLTKDILSGMYRKGRGKSDATTTEQPSNNDTVNPAEQTPQQKELHKHDRGDWTLSPSVIHNNMSTIADTPMVPSAHHAKTKLPTAAVQPPAPAPAPVHNAPHELNQSNNTQASNDTTYHAARTKSRAFSDLLRHSSAMSKYMGLGVGNQQSSPRRAQSTSPSRQPVPPTPPARDDADLGRASAPRRSHLDITPEISQSNRKKVLFDSPSFSPPTHHRPSGAHNTIHVGSHSTPADPITPRSSSFAARHPSTFVATPSRVVPLALQGKHGAGGLYTPEGHIDLNALDFDARVLQSHAAYANSMSGMDLSADLSHTMGSAEGLVNTITSTTRILIIFHRWLLRRSDHNNVHFDDDRNAALMLICHFEGMNNFVTSLFGLEQWLRDKMKLIVRTEAKAFVFRTWNLKYGVSAKSREFWRRRRLHFGFESFLEYGMKRRMHRKNALHALAARRRHANAAHMAPILRHKPARSSLNSSTSHIVSTTHFSDEENEEAGFSYPDSSGVLSPQLSRLSDLDKLNKYSNLDMSMLDMEKRHRAKQAQYFTSLSIRDILNDTKSALLVYSRGGTSAYNLRTKTQEYLQAQDTVALLFAFRRFYHRAIYITRQRKLRLLRRKQRLCACLTIWKAMYAERAQTEQALQPHVEYALEEMKVARKRIALRKLKRFVLYSQRDAARKARFAARIRSKQIYLRAFHALRCVAFVKCFDVLKSNYIKNSPTVEEIRHSAFHHQFYAVQSAFKGWRKWQKACAATRLNGFQSQSSRQLLMNTLLQKSHIRHLVQDTRNSNHHQHHHSSGNNGRNSTISMSPDTFFSLPAIRQLRLKPSMLKHTVHLTQLKRAMRRFRKIGRCTRIFFALTDLRAAQSMGRRNVASDRLKCAQHVTLNSCRILPSARDDYKNNSERDRDNDQVTHHKGARRAGAEKPFKLIGVNPLTFELFVRTLFHSTPPERHELDASFAGQANKGHRSGHRTQSLVLMDGTKLSAAPQLLRFTRKWRILCSERTQLRKICDKVRRSRALAVLKAHYEEWQKAYKQERMCNQCNKRRVLRRFQAFRQRNRHAHKVHKKTRRDLVVRHWQRLAAAHLHHTELRRLQAGHFYNAVLDGSSRRVLDFVAKHDFVPFSVRHFLSHFPSYRFPIYRQYDEAYWDHARHTDAHQALVMISQHHEAYTHDRHVTHHLELFQHHHHANFQTASASRRNSDSTSDTSTRAGQPHTYATPSHHSTFVQNSRLYQSPNRPLHLTPGAMLSHQAFSVSASIANSKYGRSGSVSPTSRGRGRSSTSPTKGNNNAKLSLQTIFDTAQDQANASYRTPSGVHSSSYGQRARSLGEVPAASELASAAMFMSHWISECLQQYYTLRRALRKLRHFGREAGRRTRKLYHVALSKQRVAVAALWQNRQDRKLTKQVRLARLRDASLKLRAVTVYLKARKRILRKIIEFMCQTHRHNLVVRTWQNRWNNVMRSAWDKLLEHTKLRNAQFAQIRNTQNRIRTVETVRIMCGVVTANSWRRRHAKVTGLRNFVQNYNRNVLAMDRDNTVRLAARIKQFGILKENLLGKLKQRLSDVVGMNYRKKSALISGFMALYCAVQQPQRQIDEATLKERMYDSIDALREKHLAYVTHQLRPGSDPADLPLALHVREHRKMRHLETMAELRASTSPYVSAVLPLPSPLPPAHTISTTVRRASMLRESGRQRATIDTLSENNPQAGGCGGLSVNTSLSGVWSPTRGTPRSGTAANILFGAAGSNGRSPYPVSGSAWDDFSVLSGTNGPSTRASSATLSAMAQRRRNAASSAANTPKSSAGADSRESAFASTYRTASGNNSPFSAGGRRSTDPSVAPSSYGSIGGFKNSVETSRFGYSLGSTANSVVSSVSNYTSHARKSSLHDAHAAVINSPTSARPSPTVHINTDPLAMSLQVPSGRSGPASILITSPAYVGSRAASRADSRIFFATSPLASGPASVASARSGRRSSVSVHGQMASSSIASRRSSVPPLSISSSVGNREASLMPPFSPLTPQTYREDNFFDDASTDASTVFTTDTPRGGGSSMRVQRRRSSVHQQRSEESVEQMWQLERAQKLYIFRRWVNELRHKKALRQYCESYHLRQLVRIHFLRMRRQAQVDRYQRVQLARVAAHRALTQLSDMCARNTEHRQILEFSEKYYLVMALKLNLRKWRARVKRRTLNRYDAINAKTFNKRRAFMKFMINLRAICTQLPLPGEGGSHSHSHNVGRYDTTGSPGRARSNFSATEWKHHSPGVSRYSSSSSSSHRTNRAMSSSNHHLQSSSTHRLRRHQSPVRSPYSSPQRSGSAYSSPHTSGYECTKGIPGHRDHKQHQYHVHYADEEQVEAEEYENRLFRSAGALTKRSIASILNK